MCITFWFVSESLFWVLGFDLFVCVLTVSTSDPKQGINILFSFHLKFIHLTFWAASPFFAQTTFPFHIFLIFFIRFWLVGWFVFSLVCHLLWFISCVWKNHTFTFSFSLFHSNDYGPKEKLTLLKKMLSRSRQCERVLFGNWKSAHFLPWRASLLPYLCFEGAHLHEH